MTTVVVGTAGHIDHGKSALVRALTGTDPDRLPEEQARGITIDLGFAHATLGDVEIAFVDVPGHERFVRNMLAGAGGIDAVVLVVAANESVKPQTREHFEICRLLGIDRGVVALTKSDLADEAMLAVARAEIQDLTRGTFLDGAPIVPVSAVTGGGLDALRGALRGLAGQRPRMHRAGVVRLPIDRVFTVKGFGAVTTGTLVSGDIAVGDELVVLPDNVPVRVRGLQTHGHSATRVTGPQRTAVNVAGIDVASLRRGQTLATRDSLAVTLRADVAWQPIAGQPPLRHGARVRVHAGTDEVIARLTVPASDAGPPPVVRLRFERASAITRGDRLILRALSPPATIGGAVVLDPDPPAAGLRRRLGAVRLTKLTTATDREAAMLFAEEAAGRGLDEPALIWRVGLDPTAARAMRDALVREGTLVMLGARGYSAQALQETRNRILAELTTYHRERPTESGMAPETLRSRLAERASAELVDAATERLHKEQKIRVADRIAMPSHAAPADAANSTLAQRIDAHLRSAGLTPPDVAVLATELGERREPLDQALRALSHTKRVVRLGDLFFHSEALRALKDHMALSRAKRPAGERVTLDVAAFKALHVLTRKHAIPLLEWLDREGVTRRIGAERVVLPKTLK